MDNEIDIVDIVGDNLPSRYIEDNEYDSNKQNFEEYIKNNNTIDNKLFEFNYNKLNFSFENKTFYNCHFYNYNSFSKKDHVTNSNFINCRFYNVNFISATFDDTTFENCVFNNIVLENSKFNNGNMNSSNFTNSNLASNNEFNNINVTNCNFNNCNMNYKLLANSYIIIDDKIILLRDYIDPKQLEYTSIIRHLSLKLIGEQINIRMKKTIETTKKVLDSTKVYNHPQQILDYLFPTIQRSISRYGQHIRRPVRDNTSNRNKSRSRSRDKQHTRSRSRSRDRRSASRGGKNKKTRKNQK